MSRNPLAPLVRAAAVLALLLAAPAVHAQLFRAYLAPTGSDSNPCTLPLPCRLLPAALAAVASGGEIWLLDSANYNNAPVAIDKSVTILAVPGTVGSVVATGGNAINVAVAAHVTLRNLVIVPLPGAGGQSGVVVTGSGASLTAEGCVFANLVGSGIHAQGAVTLHVRDSTIRGNAIGLSLSNGARAAVWRTAFSRNTDYGAYARGDTGPSQTVLDISDSSIDSSGTYGVIGYSIAATATVAVSVNASQLTRNSLAGLFSNVSTGGTVRSALSRSTVSGSNIGVYVVDTGSTLWASGNVITGNTTGINNSGGTVETAGDNAVRGNGTNVNASPAIVKITGE